MGYRGVYPELIRLVADQGVDFTAIVTATIPLRDVVRDGFEALRPATQQVKVLVRPGAAQQAG